MTMKIGAAAPPPSPLQTPAPLPATAASPAADAASAAAATATSASTGRVTGAGGGDSVTVSSAARSLDAATSADDGIDLERVASVRAAIAAGTYRVDAEKIADKLLANAQEMLGRARG